MELHTLGSGGVGNRHCARTGLSWKHPPLVESPCIQGPLDHLRGRIVKACQGRDQRTSVSILTLDINAICAVCLGGCSLTLFTLHQYFLSENTQLEGVLLIQRDFLRHSCFSLKNTVIITQRHESADPGQKEDFRFSSKQNRVLKFPPGCAVQG